jgi:CheY-like chemotaxis protein
MSNIKILCVEDEQEIRENISEILRDEGFQVLEAADGKSGYESFLKDNPDLIISDIMMPDVDGYGFLKLVRESSKNSDVPFILLSALGQKESIIKGADLMANEYLTKPIDFDILIAKIREKTTNSTRASSAGKKRIENIKSQISSTLSSEILYLVDNITQSIKTLREEPYGPLPHRKYLDELNKSYINAVRLKSSIVNGLDRDVIEKKLNANEEIFCLFDELNQTFAEFSESIKFEDKNNNFPKVKFNKSDFISTIKKIVSSLISLDSSASINVSQMIDHLDRMILIFYVHSHVDLEEIKSMINNEKYFFDDTGCNVEAVESNGYDKAKNILLHIPPYRVVK